MVPSEIRDIMFGIKRQGFDSYIIGGYVRDTIMRIPSKDIDVEVFGCTVNELAGMLQEYGKVDTVGKSFGVVKLTTKNQDYDFAIPRYESKVGVGHDDFEVHFDTNMTPYDSTLRRDFTMNAMIMDAHGQILDFHRGTRDIQYGILRPVGEAFKEDALRVLRGMQFASRFNMTASDLLIKYAQQMFDDYQHLTQDRIMHEWLKWAKGKFPQMGLLLLEETGWIKHYPQIEAMIGCEQNPKYHPEGDVWEHTQQCVAYAGKEYNNPIITMTMLTHDFGKPSTTVKNEHGNWVSPGHSDPKLGCNQFLKSIGMPIDIAKEVSELTRFHMSFAEENPSKRSVRRVMSKLEHTDIQTLFKVMECDRNGRDEIIGVDNHLQRLIEMSDEIVTDDGGIAAKVMGRHLIELGFEPSPKFGKVLSATYEAQIEHDFDFDTLLQIAIGIITEE